MVSFGLSEAVLRDIVQCALCSASYNDADHRPLRLPSCEHTACSGCVRRLLRGSDSLDCPVCGVANPVPSLAALPEQQLIKQTVARLTKVARARINLANAKAKKSANQHKLDEATAELEKVKANVERAKAMAKAATSSLQAAKAKADLEVLAAEAERASAEEALQLEILEAAKSVAKPPEPEAAKTIAKNKSTRVAAPGTGGGGTGNSNKSITRQLRTAARLGNLSDAKALLLQRLSSEVTTAALGSRTCVLVKATIDGQLDIVKYLVEQGANIEQASEPGGETALYEACRSGHTDLVRYLVEVGADMNKADVQGRTPLYAACQGGHVEAVRALCATGRAPVNQADTTAAAKTPLILACCSCLVGDTGEMAECLIAAGAKVDGRTGQGHTPLQICAIVGELQFARLLLRHGADPRALDAQGRGADELADMNKHRDIGKLIREWKRAPPAGAPAGAGV